MLAIIHAKVRTCHKLSDVQEIQSSEPDRRHTLFTVVIKGKLIKIFTIFVDFNPFLEARVGDNLIFSLQAELLVSKFAARFCTHDVMVTRLSISFHEIFL